MADCRSCGLFAASAWSRLRQDRRKPPLACAFPVSARGFEPLTSSASKTPPTAPTCQGESNAALLAGEPPPSGGSPITTNRNRQVTSIAKHQTEEVPTSPQPPPRPATGQTSAEVPHSA